MAKQNVQDRGAQISRNAEYLIVREIPRDAAQQRYWTFCEAIKFGAEKGPWFALLLRNSKKIARPEPLSTRGVINNVILNGVYLAVYFFFKVPMETPWQQVIIDALYVTREISGVISIPK